MSLQLASVFGHNMVLQREECVKIWGKSEPFDSITVTIQGQEAKTKSDGTGAWEVILQPLAVSHEETLIVRNHNTTVILENVAVGEVWLAGGQSNMEFFMRYDKDFDKEVISCTNPDIRFWDHAVVSIPEVRNNRDYTDFEFWRVCTPENLQYYSAVAYYFAKNIHEALQIPVGIIGCNCGGTTVSCWMDEETLSRCGKVWMDEYQEGLKFIDDIPGQTEKYLANAFMDKSKPFENEISDKVMYGLSRNELLDMFQNVANIGGQVIGPWHEWRPAGLFHNMLENIIPYGIKGVIWYQGESDEKHPEIYAQILGGMIDLWRRLWNKKFPFIMTQLAPLDDDGDFGNGGRYYIDIREQQEKLAQEGEKIWAASIGDVGNSYDIHPKEKRPVGERMALLARGHVYGEDLLCEAPIFKQVVTTEEGLKLLFDYADGLYVEGDRIHALQLFDADGNILTAGYETAVVDDGILIRSKTDIRKIAFAHTAYYKVNVYNAAHIPVKPFITAVD